MIWVKCIRTYAYHHRRGDPPPAPPVRLNMVENAMDFQGFWHAWSHPFVLKGVVKGGNGIVKRMPQKALKANGFSTIWSSKTVKKTKPKSPILHLGGWGIRCAAIFLHHGGWGMG